MFAIDDLITETDSDLMHFIKQPSESPKGDTETLWNKAL